MLTFKFRIVPVVALMAFACVLAPTAYGAANATAEAQDLDADILAKIAKERAKGNAQLGADRRADRKGLGTDPTNSDGCGNIGIGNIFTGGNTGFRPPREVTVIVTGDIVSANNRCR